MSTAVNYTQEGLLQRETYKNNPIGCFVCDQNYCLTLICTSYSVEKQLIKQQSKRRKESIKGLYTNLHHRGCKKQYGKNQRNAMMDLVIWYLVGLIVFLTQSLHSLGIIGSVTMVSPGLLVAVVYPVLTKQMKRPSPIGSVLAFDRLCVILDDSNEGQ